MMAPNDEQRVLRALVIVYAVALGVMLLLSVVLLAAVPRSEPVTDYFDVIELNHVYDQKGRHVLDQFIFYRWHDDVSRHHVVAWRMYKSFHQVPRFNPATKEYVATWLDTFDGEVLRRVVTKSYRVVPTLYDVELEERKELPAEKRQGLTKPPKKAKQGEPE